MKVYIRKVPFAGMTGWAVNSIAEAIKGSIPFLPIIYCLCSLKVKRNTVNIYISVQFTSKAN